MAHHVRKCRIYMYMIQFPVRAIQGMERGREGPGFKISRLSTPYPVLLGHICSIRRL